MNLKAEEIEEYRDAMNNWMKNNDLDGVIKNADRQYKYDHLARKLLDEYGWIRVPYWIPGVDTHPPERANDEIR